MQGSAVTGRKYTTGAPFDVGRRSDFDVALAGSDLFAAARGAGVSTRSGGIRTGPLDRQALRDLGLADLRRELSQLAGRKVNFMVYRSVEDAMGRSPSIKIPG